MLYCGYMIVEGTPYDLLSILFRDEKRPVCGDKETRKKVSPALLLGSLDESGEALEQSFAVLVGGMLLEAIKKKNMWRLS